MQSDYKLSIVASVASALGVTIDSLLSNAAIQLDEQSLDPELLRAMSALSRRSSEVQKKAAEMITCLLEALELEK